ncbi:MAG: DNA-deoxyinosine glycosylase [Clostridiales bacterium]|nr:DNA-deoxyinosine glycosylase [Clostridiales bacterium]
MQRDRLSHPFPPVYNERSRVLILGSFPSAASREVMFFYGHKRNRFWKVLGLVFGEEVPQDIEGRKRFLLDHGVALWDSIASCSIEGSSDSSIRDVTPNKISELLNEAPIEKIFCNGKTSHACYEKYVYPETGIHAFALPSTSPANAAKSLEQLAAEWSVIRPGADQA